MLSAAFHKYGGIGRRCLNGLDWDPVVHHARDSWSGSRVAVFLRQMIQGLTSVSEVCYHFTGMTSEERARVELLQGTLDLILLRALSTMGRQHAYGLAARLDQVADHP
jgi:hypothetical protein